MAVAKVEEKVGVLLSPQELFKTYIILESLHIFKGPGTIDYKMKGLDMPELRKHFAHLPKAGQQALSEFCTGNILEVQQTLKKSNVSTAYAATALEKHVHKNLERIKPFVGLVKMYHKVKRDTDKNPRTAPCSFSNFRPQLQFAVVKKDNAFDLDITVVLNGSAYPLNSFARYLFLLESNNEYFILSFKDHQTLQWLQQNLPLHQHDATAFAQHILARLDEDYTVNRNNLFTQKQLVVAPVNRVLLSELNNAFLMFTPQWLYDGILIDGAWQETYETVIGGETVLIQRDKEAEQAFMTLLESLHPSFAKQKNGFFYVPFAEAQKKQWFLKAYHKLLDLNIELVGMDMLHHFRYSPHKAETVVDMVKEADHTVTLHFTVHFGKEEVPVSVLQKMLWAGQRAVLLKDASLGVLSDEWLQQYAVMIKHGKVDKKQLIVPRFIAYSNIQGQSEAAVLQPLIKAQWKQKWLQWQQSAEPVYTLPSTVNATLRPYQQKGFEWMALLSETGAGSCLADDMGLGKTLQTICFLAWHLHQNPNSSCLIVCPSSLLYNWQQELAKFTPALTALVYHGAQRKPADLEQPHHIVITSYGTLRSDETLLANRQYGVCVIDESHNIKNPAAQITKAVNLVQAHIRIALSGTPVVNNTFDLYAQLNFALPGIFGSREFFKREYADPIDRDRDEEKIQALQKITAPFILRRTKEQVAKDLPSKTESILWCSMSAAQQNLYDDIKEQIKGNLFLEIKNNGLNKSKMAVLQGILKLRQVCNSPLLLPATEQQGCTQSVKTEMLLNELDNIISGGHKALVFSQFSTMLQLLAAECDKRSIAYYHFDGQTPPAQRTAMVQQFQQPGNTTNLFLISLKAGNAGLTLTAADYVFLFDPWWNTAVEQQAIDRTHRIGQDKNVFAYKLACKGSVEEKIIQLQQQKKQLAGDLVTEDDSFVKTLSEDDITYLFS
jgi:SNF2 family DNA or RNA helicase